MLSSLLLALSLLFIVNAALSAVAGAALARRRGLASWIGLLSGAAVPWIGLLLPALLGSRRPPSARASRRPVLTGFLPLLIGAVLVFASHFVEWVRLRGAVETSAETFSKSFNGGLGDTVFGAVLLSGGTLLVLGLGLLLWMRPLIVAAVGLAWVAAGAASMVILAGAGSLLVRATSGVAAQLTAGHASADLALAAGTWVAGAGSVLIAVGALSIVTRVGATGSRWQSKGGARELVPSSAAVTEAVVTLPPTPQQATASAWPPIVPGAPDDGTSGASPWPTPGSVPWPAPGNASTPTPGSAPAPWTPTGGDSARPTPPSWPTAPSWPPTPPTTTDGW
ncbi:MAG: hypothetical protein IPJ14_17625 [Kineosporiaceae bacterium]|nr:hypothetical protein [Kineosporiaceae bacterium]MBK7624422.1 hypothetical protein [Kineosporiaceae bacterium]MBK8077786.1 hypothetical protein [Kineosporiaceae bacterium]